MSLQSTYEWIATADGWLRSTLGLMAFAIILTKLEVCANLRHPVRKLTLDWKYLRFVSKCERIPSLHFLRPLMANWSFSMITMIILIAAVALLALQIWGSGTSYRVASAIMVAVIVLGHIHDEIRGAYGLDGTFSVTFQVSGISFLALCFAPDSFAFHACVVYLFGQCILSYFIAGVGKSFGEVWQNGSAVRLVLGTNTYGNMAFASWLSRHNAIAVSATYTVLVFELATICMLFPSEPVMLSLLGVAFLFHVGNGIVMGLNHFLFAFISFYPSVIFGWHILWGDSH